MSDAIQRLNNPYSGKHGSCTGGMDKNGKVEESLLGLSQREHGT